MINVTKSFLPPYIRYEEQLQRIWESAWLSNRGGLCEELEGKIKDFLNCREILLTANGTLPLHLAIKVLKLKGEIITTPLSYVATTSSIVWENCTPVYVDIDPEYLTIDEKKIAAAITPKTSAILATHVYGNPCNVAAIDAIAKKHSLKVIYDGAHSFGVSYMDKSIFNYGDITTCSFHATKVFHTGEGGALFCNQKGLRDKLNVAHNFGHITQYEFSGVGINAKMSELHAAMGLAILPYMNAIIAQRILACNLYREAFEHTSIKTLRIREKTRWNGAYFPVILKDEDSLLRCLKVLHENEINPRRYFYPSLNTLDYVEYQKMPVSEDISKRILCLPLYYGLENNIIDKIASLLIKTHE